MKKDILAIRELFNYFYLLRKSKKAKKHDDRWIHFGLRISWFGKIWKVINLREEDIGEEDLVKQARIIEKIKPINSYLKELDLHEIIYPSIDKKTKRSYLLVYTPLFKYFTLLRFIKFSLIISLITYLILNFSSILVYLSNLV